jgi:E3 ubiquitin-protein ligase RNF5
MNKWKILELEMELNHKDKKNFPPKVNNLYNIFFFKKKKSNIFFFKSEKKYKMKITLHINIDYLRKLVILDNEIPYLKELTFFFNNILKLRKNINNKQIINEIEYLDENTNCNIKIYDNKILKLDNKLYFNKNKFEISSNYYKKNYGKIILSEQNFDNHHFILNILKNEKNKNFKLLMITDRDKFWIDKFNQPEIKTDNIIIVNYDNIEKYTNDIYWNNIIIDISSTNIKKDFSYNLKYKKKYLFINKYYLLDNYENVFNLYFKNYKDILLDTKNLSNFIYINKSKLNKDINIFNKFINLNEIERKEYNAYIDKFKTFYQKNNISFTEDIYLRKFCCYPQKNLKINILNYKNINKDIELFDIEGEYKNKINKSIKKIKNTIKNKNQCFICLNNINIKNVGITKCGHLFCYTCIYKCIDYKNECPTCRYKITTNDIYYIKNSNNINKFIINNGLIDDLGTKIKKLISLVKHLKKVIIFSNYIECINLLKNIFNQINIVENQEKSVIFLDYNINNFDDNNINDIIFLDPLYEQEKYLSIKYKGIFNQIKNKKINVYNLIINNTIEKDIYNINKNILISI